MSSEKEKEIDNNVGRPVHIVTLDQYQQAVQEKIDKVIVALKKINSGQSIEELKIKEGEKSLFRGLFDEINKHSKIFNTKIPELQKCHLELDNSLTELSKFKKNFGREEILEHAIINHMADAMFVTDLSGKIMIINETAKETLGYGLDKKIIGEDVFSLVEWKDKKGNSVSREDNPVTRAIEKGEMIRVTFPDGWNGVRMNGSLFPVRINASPVKVQDEIKAIVLVFHDASRERRIDEIKSDFISIASHQLRTPLAVSTLHAEMLLAGHVGELNEEQREYVEEINFYNKKMAELLTVFLSVSKIEMDTFTLEREPLEMESILEDITRELSAKITERELELEKIYYRKLPKVCGDKGLLRVAFQNIIANAIKYTPVGGKVTIETKLTGDNILVKVTDTGMGIEESDKSRVFMKLYRGKSAKKTDSEGTGLGLYIAKSFIEKNGGQIWFESKEKLGTTFYISLPVLIKK